MKRSSQPNPLGEDSGGGSGGSWSSSAKRFMDVTKRSTTPLEDGKKVDLLHDTGQQHGNVRSSNPYSRPSTSYSRTSSTITATSGAAGPSFSSSLSGLGTSSSSATTSMVNERPAHRSNYSLELKEFLARKKSEREQQQNIPSLTHRSVHTSSSLLTSVRNRSSMTPSTSSSITHTFSSSLMPSSSTTTAWSQRLPSSSSSRPVGQYQREDGDNLPDVSFQPKSLPSFKFPSGSLSTSSTTAATSGKVIFGGASARRVARLASANPYFRTVTGSRPPPPVLRVHVSDAKRSPINEDDMLSSSAKRVFDVITRLTTPLEDAKKIPLSDSGLSNRTVYGTYNGPYRGHLTSLGKSSLSRTRTLSTTPASTLPIGTPGISSSLIQKSTPPPPTVRDQSHRLNWKLEFKDFVDKTSEKQHPEPSTSQSLPQSKPLLDIASTPVPSDNRGGLSSALKMRAQKSSGRLSTRLEEQQRPFEETVELPDISFQPKSLPKFNFSSTITSTPVPAPSTKLSSTTEEFIFSPPPPIPSAQISKPVTMSQPEIKESFEFKFSSTGKKRVSFSDSNDFVSADSEKYNKVTFPSTSRSPLTETNKPPPAVPAIPAEKSTPKWKCDSCWILNPETQPKCMACDEPRPSANGIVPAKTTIPSTDKTKLIIGATPAKVMASPTFGSSPINVTPQANKVAAPKPTIWRCDTCLITNPETIKKCQACEMPRPSKNATSLEETPAYKFGNLSEAASATPTPFRFGFESKVNDTSAITNNVNNEKKDDKLEKNEKETSEKTAAPVFGIPNSIVSSSKNDNPPIINFGFTSEKTPSTSQTLSTQQPSITPSISFGDSNSTTTEVLKLCNNTESAQQNSLSTTSASTTPFMFGIQNTSVNNISSTEPAKITDEVKKLDEKLDKAENTNLEKTSTSSFTGFNFGGNNSGFKFGDTDSGFKFGDNNSGIKFGVPLEKKEQIAEKSAVTPSSESQPSQGFSFTATSTSSPSPFVFGASTATTTTTAATAPVTTTTTAATPAPFSFNVPSTNPPTFVSLSASTVQTSKADAEEKKDQNSATTEKSIFGKPPSSMFGNTIVTTSKTENAAPSSIFTPSSLQPPSSTSTLLPASLQPSKTPFSFLGQSNTTTFQFGNSSQIPPQSSILQPSTSSTMPPFGSLFSAKPNDTSAPVISNINEEKKDNKVETEKPASTPLLFGNTNATFPNFKNDNTPNFNFGSNALQQPSSSPFTGNQQPASATSPFSFGNQGLPSNFKFGNAASSQPNSQQPATPLFQFGGNTPNQGTPSSSGYNFAAAIASPAVPIFGAPANSVASPPQPFSTPNAQFNPLVNQTGTPSFFTPGATGNANTPYGTASKSGRTMIKAKRRLGGGR